MVTIYRDEDHKGHKVENTLLINPRMESLTGAPATGSEGQFFYNKALKRIQFFDDTSWNTVASGGTAMRYKGTVADWGDLPTTGNVGGDYWINSTTQTSRVWNENAHTWDDTGSVSIVVDEALSTTSANPIANKAVANGLNGKLNTPGNVPGLGIPYNLPYFFYIDTSATDALSVHAKTITLDNHATQGDYSLEVPIMTNDDINALFGAW